MLGKRSGEYVVAVGARRAPYWAGSVRTASVLRGGFAHPPAEPLSDIDAYFELACNLGGSSCVKLSDTDVAHLARFGDCHYVDLSREPISDAALAHLRGLHRLEYLFLSDTAITDNGLAQLHDLKSLRQVYLDHSRVTPAGIDALVRAIPGVDVVSEDVATRLNEFEPQKPVFTHIKRQFK